MALWIILVAVTLGFLYVVRGVLMPFVIAILLAAILEPTVQKLIARGYSRKKAVFLLGLAGCLVLVSLGIWLTPVVSQQVTTFRYKFETISSQVNAQNAYDHYFMRWNPRVQMESSRNTQAIDSLFDKYRGTLSRLGLPTTRRAAMQQYVEPHREEITNAAQNFVGGILGAISNMGAKALLLLFAPIFTIMLLLQIDSIKARMAALIPPAIRTETVDLFQDISQVFVKYLQGVSKVLMYYVILAGIVLSVLGVPYAILLAFLFAFIYLIPYLGSILNVAVIVLLTGTSGKLGPMFYQFPNSWTFAAVAGVIYFIVFMVFDQVVYAPTVGGSVGLHPMVSFFVVFSGGALFGPLGMVLAFPVAGAVKVVLDRLLAVTSKTHDLQLPCVPIRHREAT